MGVVVIDAPKRPPEGAAGVVVVDAPKRPPPAVAAGAEGGAKGEAACCGAGVPLEVEVSRSGRFEQRVRTTARVWPERTCWCG